MKTANKADKVDGASYKNVIFEDKANRVDHEVKTDQNVLPETDWEEVLAGFPKKTDVLKLVDELKRIGMFAYGERPEDDLNRVDMSIKLYKYGLNKVNKPDDPGWGVMFCIRSDGSVDWNGSWGEFLTTGETEFDEHGVINNPNKLLQLGENFIWKRLETTENDYMCWKDWVKFFSDVQSVCVSMHEEWGHDCDFKTVMDEWIDEYGSAHLKHVRDAGYMYFRGYREERGRREYGDAGIEYWDLNDDAEYKTRDTPSELMMSVAEKLGGRVVWVTNPPITVIKMLNDAGLTIPYMRETVSRLLQDLQFEAVRIEPTWSKHAVFIVDRHMWDDIAARDVTNTDTTTLLKLGQQ